MVFSDTDVHKLALKYKFSRLQHRNDKMKVVMDQQSPPMAGAARVDPWANTNPGMHKVGMRTHTSPSPLCSGMGSDAQMCMHG